jgi:molecular chaperone DnaK (HSP70)
MQRYEAEDAVVRGRVEARIELEGAAYKLKTAVGEASSAASGAVDGSSLEHAEAVAASTLEWLESSAGASADADEYRSHLSEVREAASSIMRGSSSGGGGDDYEAMPPEEM